MEKIRIAQYEIVQETKDDWFFEQRETQKYHTPYAFEQRLLNCIRDGNISRLDQILGDVSQPSLLVGKLSSNTLRQAQYLAVAFMTLATRSAIQGGMFEMDAYNRSDAFIQKIDQQSNPGAVMQSIVEMLKSLTVEMHALKVRKNYSPQIRVCLEFIYQNLHSKISLKSIASRCNLSSSYLSRLFKREVGMNLSTYIIQQKIDAAKSMMANSMRSIKEISTTLEFSSQSYFISCFKRHCGLTPGEYLRQKVT